MTEWNAMSYEGKDTILRVVRDEAEGPITLASEPGAWDAPTACEGWTRRDVIGHLVDTIESYFASSMPPASRRALTPTGSRVWRTRVTNEPHRS